MMKKTMFVLSVVFSVTSSAQSFQYKVYYPTQSTDKTKVSGVVVTQEDASGILQMFQCGYYLNQSTPETVLAKIRDNGIKKFTELCGSLQNTEQSSGNDRYVKKVVPVKITPFARLYSGQENILSSGNTYRSAFTIEYSKIIIDQVSPNQIARKIKGTATIGEGKIVNIDAKDILKVIGIF